MRRSQCRHRTNSIIPDITGRGAKVNDGAGKGAARSKGVHVSHDVVLQATLFLGSKSKVDVGGVGPHLRYLCIGYVDAELLLRLSKVCPERAPRGNLQ